MKSYRVEELIKLGKLVVNDGYRAKNSELSNDGVPFARAGNLNNGFQFDDADMFPFDKLKGVGNKISQEGDVVFTSKGTVGRFAYVDRHVPQFVYSPQLCFWRSLDYNFLDPIFLFYWMQSKEFIHQLNAVKGQTDMADYVSLQDQKKMTVTIPTREVQRASVVIPKIIDDLIFSYKKSNELLENISQKLFKSWFVDFDPVHAKKKALDAGLTKDQAERAAMATISGLCKPIEYAQEAAKVEKKLKEKLSSIGKEKIEELKTTASLFPSEFEYSELGEIPKGWGVKSLGEIVTRFKQTKKYTKENIVNTGKTIVFEQGEKLVMGFTEDEADFYATVENPMFFFGDHTCVMKLWCSPFSISSNVIPLGKKDYPAIWTFYACQGKQTFQEYRRHWMEFVIKKTVAPNIEIAKEYSRIVTPLQCKAEANSNESVKLTQLRDNLLPKLLSGEIDLSGVLID